MNDTICALATDVPYAAIPSQPQVMNDTICALATAPGGALGIIRVSGPHAFTIVSTLSSFDCDTATANTIHFARLYASHALNDTPCDPLTQHRPLLDEVLLSVFRAPHSYTGEDSVEISCHGSRYIINKVLELLIQQGCRMARPGEFTQRAYLNGKMDLSQAEAVADLIASTNKATHNLALSQLRGSITSELTRLREQLLKLTSLLELELDFSDHEDLEFADRTELLSLAQTIDAHINRLARSFETGQALKQGIPVAIVGKTNVGKSTLLNALLKDDRAIVSDIHGTTRDTIEDCIDIRGISFRFIDTAGIRQTTDQVEQIGIQRTYQAIAKARIVLWLIDDAPDRTEILDMSARCQGRALIVVQNKIDKRTIAYDGQCVKISAKYGQGLNQLEAAIFAAADIPEISETDIVVSSARQYHALVNARNDLSRVISSLQENLSADLVSEDLNLVLDSLSEITGQGRIVPTEVLSNIFKNFCVGK